MTYSIAVSEPASLAVGVHPKPVPLQRRIRSTLFEPGRLVSDLRTAAPWLDVLLIATLIAVIGVLTLPDDVFTESMREAVTRRGRPVEITSPPEVIARWNRLLGMLATLGTHPMIAFVLAGLLTGVFSILGGGRGTYRDYLSLSAHSLLIPALGTLIVVAVRVASGLGGMVPPGGFFRPEEANSFWTAALSAVDPFLIWMLIVVGIGVNRIDGRLSSTRAGLILVVAYLLLMAGTTALLHPEL